ncbi:MAG TPA: hypothetical protein VN677_01295 [Gemmatimonadaceae bacterium]|nr:hypothetical protein [Gemmatimonadaceae bacterium]
MSPAEGGSADAFILTAEDRGRLRTDINLDAFERLLAVLPLPARRLLLQLAARSPDLLAIWNEAPALRDNERGTSDNDGGYSMPRLDAHAVPRLEDVTLSNEVLQQMLADVFHHES